MENNSIINDPHFNTWFFSKLKTGPLPDNDYLHKLGQNNTDVIINVSCHFDNQMLIIAKEYNMDYHWLPLNEHSKSADIGLNSIYGALHILHVAEMMNKKVYLHCSAGVNRCMLVHAAYYFMRKGKHCIYPGKQFDADILKMFNPPEDEIFQVYQDPNSLIRDFDTGTAITNEYKPETNMLLHNIAIGSLPVKTRMELFIKIIGANLYLNKQKGLDSIKLKSDIN